LGFALFEQCAVIALATSAVPSLWRLRCCARCRACIAPRIVDGVAPADW